MFESLVRFMVKIIIMEENDEIKNEKGDIINEEKEDIINKETIYGIDIEKIMQKKSEDSGGCIGEKEERIMEIMCNPFEIYKFNKNIIKKGKQAVIKYNKEKENLESILIVLKLIHGTSIKKLGYINKEQLIKLYNSVERIIENNDSFLRELKLLICSNCINITEFIEIYNKINTMNNNDLLIKELLLQNYMLVTSCYSLHIS